jgi:hypothetical protein
MLIRFVIHSNGEDSGRRQGLFQAMKALETSGVLFHYEQERYDEIRGWFNKNLERPTSFARSSKPHAKNVALSWFKDSATAHIAKMHELVFILRSHGIEVDVIRTERPGYMVYEDQYQIATEPFQETAT